VILSVKAEVAGQVLNRAWDAGIPAARIGTVGGDRLVIDVPGDDRTTGCTINLEVRTLQDRWANAIEKALETA
jgi:hypothetical protein